MVKAVASKAAELTPPRRFSFLRVPATIQRRGVSRSAHYADVKLGLFTKPVRLGPRTAGYPDYEVDALNAATLAGRPAAEIRGIVAALHAARVAGTTGAES